jgi:hypothetical protein
MVEGKRNHPAGYCAGAKGKEEAPKREQKAMTNGEHNDIPPCQIRIQKDGKWYHKGREMIHRDFIRLFYENMELDDEGRYIIYWDGKPCYVEVEDTAFVVMRVDALSDGTRFLLTLSDDTQEILASETLRVSEENVLYSSVKSGVFPARFTRPAYYQLAQFIQEDEQGYYLEAEGKKHYVQRDVHK